MIPELIMIGGVPGSGKTYIGKKIAESLNAVYLDKDTLSRVATEAMLVSLGGDPNDRESTIYISKIRQVEYDTLLKVAIENIEMGNSVVCTAPFISEFNDSEWVLDRKFDADFNDCALKLLWMHTDEKSARLRIASRSADRDIWKLSHWDEYVKQTPHSLPSQDFINHVIYNYPDYKLSVEQQLETIIA